MKRRILNLGAGTQSSVLLVMADRGDIEPVEVAIFADTEDEPQEVYDHLAWLHDQVRNTPIVTVKTGPIASEALEYQRAHAPVGGRYASIPLYTANGAQNRQCTKYYKVIPIRRYIREHVLKLAPRQHVPAGTIVTQVFGLHFDERDRMRSPTTKFEQFEYPLVDRKMRRQAVIDLSEKWFPDHVFPRSACKRCPYRLDDEWMALTPDEFNEVCDWDDEMRALDIAGGGSGVFVHQSRKPLREVRLGQHTDQLFGIRNECEGMCGV
jgi:hypothetical protein